jgi:hypothetical protein
LFRSGAITHYFRGTSEGWPGSEALQLIGVTPVTTDPIVATIFATYAAQFGHAVIHVATDSELQGVQIESGNVLQALELEVALAVTPAEFARLAICTIAVTHSHIILDELGIRLPRLITDPFGVDLALRNSPRLTVDQVQYYVGRARAFTL